MPVPFSVLSQVLNDFSISQLKQLTDTLILMKYRFYNKYGGYSYFDEESVYYRKLRETIESDAKLSVEAYKFLIQLFTETTPKQSATLNYNEDTHILIPERLLNFIQSAEQREEVMDRVLDLPKSYTTVTEGDVWVATVDLFKSNLNSKTVEFIKWVLANENVSNNYIVKTVEGIPNLNSFQIHVLKMLLLQIDRMSVKVGEKISLYTPRSSADFGSPFIPPQRTRIRTHSVYMDEEELFELFLNLIQKVSSEDDSALLVAILDNYFKLHSDEYNGILKLVSVHLGNKIIVKKLVRRVTEFNNGDKEGFFTDLDEITSEHAFE